MTKVLVTEDYLGGIADGIRYANGGSATYKPPQMENAIRALKKTLVEKSVTANGDYDPASDSADGYSGVSVNVPNSYAAGDEGKVVSNGALVAQTARASQITANGTYNTTTNNSVTVNVSGGGGGSIATNGLQIYYDGLDNTGSGHDGSATQWTDLSGNGNHGSVYNGTWGSDELQFNGSSTHVKCGQHNPTVLTVEAIVRWNSSSNMIYGDEVCSNLESGGYALYLKNGKMAFVANIGGTYKTAECVAPNFSRYYHIAGVVDTNRIKLYVNGVEVATTISGSLKPPGNDTELMLGANPNGSAAIADWLNGRVKAFRLYNRVLSDSELMSNYLHDLTYYGLA